MLGKRVFVVFNPVAGTEDPDELRTVIEQRLDEAGWEYTIHTTTEDEDIELIIRDAPPEAYDLVVAVGGDGTVSGVAGGLVDAETPMGIIPSGTGNALAHYLNIPNDPGDAIMLLAKSNVLKTLDALRIGQKHYFLNFSVGVSAATMRDTGRGQKRSLGLIAYLINGVKELVGIQPAHFKLVVDGTTFNIRAADILVLNNSLMGSMLLPNKSDLAFDKGQVSVLIFRTKSLADYIAAIWHALWNTTRSRSKNLRILSASTSVMIEPDQPLPVQADGEPLDLRSVTAHILPQAVKIIKPEERNRIDLKVVMEQVPTGLLKDVFE